MNARKPEDLHSRLGYAFRDPSLLREALTHPGAGPSPAERAADYDRLEFLGDRVLGLVTAHYLFAAYPDADAGELALRYNARVRRETLAKVAESLDLGDYILFSKSEKKTGGRAKPAILADVCEAVIGALYLDGGLEVAERFIAANWREIADELGSGEKDPKTALQEWAHRSAREAPDYVVVAQEGPPHAPQFTVEVRIPGVTPATGQGRSKRVAEQSAAATMLEGVDRQPQGRRKSR